MNDIIILGGGPAGMTAAVYAARKKLDALLISKDQGGQPLLTMGVENYMGYQFIGGSELMEKFEEQLKQFELKTIIGPQAVQVRKVEGGFDVTLDDGSIHLAKTVIVATGKKPRPLNVEGEEKLQGRGLTYCSVCDGPLFAEQKVAVIGGGNSALEATNDMLRLAEHVYLVSITPLTGDPILIDRVSSSPNLDIFLEHEVAKIEGDKFVEGLTIRDLKTRVEKKLAVSGIFVEIGLIPNSDLVKGLASLNKVGEIEVSTANETGVPGLYAAGDVTNVLEKQIVIAAGEGAKATLQAHKYLQRLV